MNKMKPWRLLLRLALLLVIAGLAACGTKEPAPPTQETTQASLGEIQLTAHPASLEGKTVVLRWNGKPNGDKFLTRVAELLSEQVSGVKIIKLWETNPETAASSESAEVSAQFADKIAALAPDLVIASQCD